MTPIQQVLVTCGIWALSYVVLRGLCELFVRIVAWRARQREARETQAAIDELIRECRAASRCFVSVEPKGRG